MLSFGLHNRRALGKIVGKFSEHKTVTSVLVRCEIVGNPKSFSDEAHKNGTSWCTFCAVLNCLNYSKSKVSTFKFPTNSKLRKQWLLKMKRKEFQPEKNSRIGSIYRRLLQRKSGNT